MTTQDSHNRAHRARYLLAMGITPWVSAEAEAPAAVLDHGQPLETAPAGATLPSIMVILVGHEDHEQWDWATPQGHLLNNMLYAAGLNREQIRVCGTNPDATLPAWQFGETDVACGSGTMVFPALDQLLSRPSLKSRVWQTILSGSA